MFRNKKIDYKLSENYSNSECNSCLVIVQILNILAVTIGAIIVVAEVSIAVSCFSYSY